MYATAAVLAVAGLAFVPAGLLLVLFGVTTAALGQAAVRGRRKPFGAALQTAAAETAAAFCGFTSSNQFPACHAARRRAERARGLDGFPALRAARLRQMQANRRTEQLNALLNSRLMENARILGIGAARPVTLAAYGITTAADISNSAITSDPAFGPSLATCRRAAAGLAGADDQRRGQAEQVVPGATESAD